MIDLMSMNLCFVHLVVCINFISLAAHLIHSEFSSHTFKVLNSNQLQVHHYINLKITLLFSLNLLNIFANALVNFNLGTYLGTCLIWGTISCVYIYENT